MEDNLCQRYTALSPFDVRKEKLGEVLLLVKRINEKSARSQGVKHNDQVVRYKNGDIHIRRKAQNDNWY
ncbi:hypothetical protein [uncultured Methanobrevibacter sp.]|uniref:hypothetical protein n=1 Tax=uncultured Methanobrevibacter sp. TaxID=253161 RepID=UPI0026190125|nr:hypothetical protein [uncultured Methanobrevibacter sp.]